MDNILLRLAISAVAGLTFMAGAVPDEMTFAGLAASMSRWWILSELK